MEVAEVAAAAAAAAAAAVVVVDPRARAAATPSCAREPLARAARPRRGAPRAAGALASRVRPARLAAEDLVASRAADRASTSWELDQARARRARVARADERALLDDLNRTQTRLDDWRAVATVARLTGAAVGRGDVAIDPLDKRIYWLAGGATLLRARYGPGGIRGGSDGNGGNGGGTSTETLVAEAGPAASSLFVHRPSGSVYWTAQGAGGSTYEVRRAHLDGSAEEVVLSGMPPQTRVVEAHVSALGTLSAAYISVAQPGNASLLLLVEAKGSAADASPSNRSVATLLRDVAPTAVAQHRDAFYMTVSVARAIRRCALDGSACVNIHSTQPHADRLPWVVRPRRSAPARLSLASTRHRGELLAWADAAADRVFLSSDNGSHPVPLWWPDDYHPTGAVLSVEGAAPPPPPPRAPVLVAVRPLGGPVAGNTSVTVHGVALGHVRELRYIRPDVWPAPDAAGLGLSFLPMCHEACPQSVRDITYLDQGWRRMRAAKNGSHASSSSSSAAPARC